MEAQVRILLPALYKIRTIGGSSRQKVRAQRANCTKSIALWHPEEVLLLQEILLPALYRIIESFIFVILKGVKNGTVILVEAEIPYNARNYRKETHSYLSTALSICGQNNNNLIFTTQNSAFIDINILKHSSMILLKEPSFMQISGITEKPAIKKLYDECIDIFEELKARNEPLEPYFFVWSENFRGMVRFDLPACWTDKLAHASDAFLSCSE